MITFTVKNIPPNLYEKLKKSAELNRRSINSEIIVCIERSVSSHQQDPDQLLLAARRFREKTSDYLISEDEFDQAKESGRA